MVINMKKVRSIPKTQRVLEVLTLGEKKQFKIARIANTNEYILYAVSPSDGVLLYLARGQNPQILEEKAQGFDWTSI